MNAESRISLHWMVLALSAAMLVAVGAGATYFAVRQPMAMSPPGSDVTPPSTAPASPPVEGADVAVTLSDEAVTRAGIELVTVTAGRVAEGLRASGVVEPNAYRQVVVTPLVSGRLTSVTAELGQEVRQGQTLARIFSPELSEAKTRYVSAVATLDAHDRELARTEQLVGIGAASRQELERVHADHTARRADVQSAAARLELLGLSSAAIAALGPDTPMAATTDVPAPVTGVVTERNANVGLNVDQTTRLFTVVDLSSVWVVADIYERDFGSVRIGTPATISTPAYPAKSIGGKVSYLDPQVNPNTRTARARIEVPNRGAELRLGMYADVLFDTGGSSTTPLVPRVAVQHVANRSVVYVVDPARPDRFVERDVRLGPAAGEFLPVLSGVQPGDVVAGKGSFYVRAEVERLGLRPAVPPPAASGPVTAASGSVSAVQAVRVVVSEQGYEPATVTVRAGVPVRLTFLRTTDATCGTEVLFPSMNIKRALPLNEPVVIEFTPGTAGDIAFACGMGMLNGAVVVR